MGGHGRIGPPGSASIRIGPTMHFGELQEVGESISFYIPGLGPRFLLITKYIAYIDVAHRNSQ